MTDVVIQAVLVAGTSAVGPVIVALIGHFGHAIERESVTVDDVPRGKCLLATHVLGTHYVNLDVQVAGREVFQGYIGAPR
jgi:hypothetical protein